MRQSLGLIWSRPAAWLAGD